MSGNMTGFVVLAVLSIGTALSAFALLHRSARALLDEVVKLPSATVFYVRFLATGLLFIALAAMLGTHFDLKPDSARMEYVWKVAGGLSSVFNTTCLFLMGYLVLVTILVSVLRRGNDK